MTGMLRLGAIALFTVGLSFGTALADALDDAKSAGLVGERLDGYLGVVDSGAPADVKRLVEQINAEREAKYAEITKEHGAPVTAVAQIAGEKLIRRAGSGEYVMGADGQWRQK
jgi:uncharacterized protein YdbL (DUF1318 family)